MYGGTVHSGLDTMMDILLRRESYMCCASQTSIELNYTKWSLDSRVRIDTTESVLRRITLPMQRAAGP